MTNAIATHLEAIAEILKEAAHAAEEAARAAQEGQINLAIGTVAWVETSLPDAQALLAAALILHRRG